MIDSFSDEYKFLSNFAAVKVTLSDVEYPSVENAFQAAKTLDPSARRQFRNCSAGEAKKLGRKLKLRPDWEAIKLGVMEDLLRQKFSQEGFRQALLDTGQEELVEGNYWGDRFWGTVDGVGDNHLGELLMKIREELRCD